jgi:hypothetical protein
MSCKISFASSTTSSSSAIHGAPTLSTVRPCPGDEEGQVLIRRNYDGIPRAYHLCPRHRHGCGKGGHRSGMVTVMHGVSCSRLPRTDRLLAEIHSLLWRDRDATGMAPQTRVL